MATSWARRVEWVLGALRAREEFLKGCDRAMIDAVERDARGALPASYVAFLLGAGWDAGDFMRGSDLSIGRLPRLQRDFRSATAGVRPPIPESAFAFCGHHGYQYLWFVLGDAADPVAYYFNDARPESIECTHKTFSQGLVQMVCDEYRIEAPRELA